MDVRFFKYLVKVSFVNQILQDCSNSVMLLCRSSGVGGAGHVENVTSTTLNKVLHVIMLFMLPCVLHRFLQTNCPMEHAC